MTEHVIFDAAKRDRLRDAYNQAVAAKKDQFDFEGNTLVTGYAKYMLEYLDLQLKG